MIVYHYHPDTKVLLGHSDAFPSPLEEDVFLIPAHATDIPPPEPEEGFDRVFNGDEWSLVAVPEPENPGIDPEPETPEVGVTTEMLIAERDLRLALGFHYDFADERGVHIFGTTPEDMRKWMDEVSPLAQAHINNGTPDNTIQISTETGQVSVTAAEWQQILLAAGVHRQPIYMAYFALKAMEPPPENYADDVYWP